ncbi:hypothetical protein Cus16_3005 [Curtobacterium sp. ER1/6]|nr:hypothetical protein Cus16_3005 [Curtobacterium sp. ER1/6]
MHDRVGERLRRVDDVGRREAVRVVAERPTERLERGTPEHPGRAAGGGGPRLTGAAEDEGDPCLPAGLLDRPSGRTHPLHHAAAVVAVAGDRVDATERLLGVAQELVHRHHRGACGSGGRPGGGARRRRDGRLRGGLGHRRGRHERGDRRRHLAVARCVGVRPPPALEVVVEPLQGQGAPAHVQARDDVADLGLDDLEAGGNEQGEHPAPQEEELLLRRVAEAVEHRRDPRADAVRTLVEEPVDEQGRERGRGEQWDVADARLAVDPETEPEVPVRHAEQRPLRAGQGAAGGRDADRPGRGVAASAGPLDLVDRCPCGGRGAHGLEHGEGPRDPASVGGVRGRGDVVGHGDDPGVDALGAEPLGREPEVHPVAGVVAEGQDDAASLVGCPGDRPDLCGGRRGEDVADDGAGRQARADEPAEGRVVAGAAADDDGHLRLGAGGGQGDDAAVDGADAVGVQRDPAGELVLGELLGSVVDGGHGAGVLRCRGWVVGVGVGGAVARWWSAVSGRRGALRPAARRGSGPSRRRRRRDRRTSTSPPRHRRPGRARPPRPRCRRTPRHPRPSCTPPWPRPRARGRAPA